VRAVVGDSVIAIDVLTTPDQNMLFGDADGDLVDLRVHS